MKKANPEKIGAACVGKSEQSEFAVWNIMELRLLREQFLPVILIQFLPVAIAGKLRVIA